MPSVSAVAESPGSLAVATRTDDSVAVLTVGGVLNASNSGALRESISKATLQKPTAVIVNISELKVPTESAWSAFISAHLQLGLQAKVPIVLVSTHRTTREAVTRSEVTRFMPVYSTEKGALKGLGRLTRQTIQRAGAELPANLSSLRESRRLVRQWLTEWKQPGLIPVALVVVNVFVENVLEHT